MPSASRKPGEKRSLPIIKKRARESHKGIYGKVSIVGGSLGMTGAVFLAGQGALKGGAGLIELIVPEAIVDILSVKVTSLMIKWLPGSEEGDFGDAAGAGIQKALEGSSIVAAGPGMRTSGGSQAVMRFLAQDCSLPLVADADGLNALAAIGPELLTGRAAPVAITPHPGEMARLTGMTTAAVQKHRLDTAVEFSRQYGVITVLKGWQTIVTDGAHYYVNHCGNPGMAVGGSGDVLTGLIAGLASSAGLSLFEAAAAACWIHGTAGDLAARAKGEISMSAEDILENIHKAFSAYRK